MTQSGAQTLLQSLPQSFASDALAELRAKAASAVREVGLPTKKTEAWRFTPVSSITRDAFVRAKVDQPGRLAQAPSGDDDTWRLLVVDGVPRLDAAKTPPSAVKVRNLREALEHPDALQVLSESGPRGTFAALNTALFSDGVWIQVEPGAHLDTPIHLDQLALGAEARTVSYPRVLITAGSGCEFTLIESCAGDDERRLTNAVVQIALAEDATMNHVRIHEDAGSRIAYVHVRQARASQYRSQAVTLNGTLLRLNLHVELLGVGASCELSGAYLANGQDHIDYHVLVEHKAARCNSRQNYRGVIDERGTAVFDGVVEVKRDAQKTEAHQENRNLLLCDTATVHTKPHLEIDADDVICSHGATVGSLDADQLFYLRTRGISQDAARALLTHAFVQTVVDNIQHAPTRDRLSRSILTRLPHGDLIRGLQ